MTLLIKIVITLYSNKQKIFTRSVKVRASWIGSTVRTMKNLPFSIKTSNQSNLWRMWVQAPTTQTKTCRFSSQSINQTPPLLSYLIRIGLRSYRGYRRSRSRLSNREKTRSRRIRMSRTSSSFIQKGKMEVGVGVVIVVVKVLRRSKYRKLEEIKLYLRMGL